MRKLHQLIAMIGGVTCLAVGQTTLSDVPQIELSPVKTVELPFTTNGVYSLPLTCSGNRLYFPSAFGLVTVAENGERVGLLSKSAITEIQNPKLGLPFATDSDVYILGHSDYGEREATFKLPDGTIVKGKTVSDRRYFIAQYKPDGKYVRLVKLDVPFAPLQLGVFPSGGFLVAGEDRSRRPTEPRVALLRSDGGLDRLVDMNEDFRESADAATGNVSKDAAISRTNAVLSSVIVSDGRNLLLVRRGTPKAYSVNDGGEVHALNVKSPDGYTMRDLQSAGSRLVATYTRHRDDGLGMDFVVHVFYRDKEDPIAKFSYPRRWGLPLGCTDGSTFRFLRAEKGKLLLVTATVAE
jgi:hypothetical protein